MGLSVALIEQGALGGTCLNVGCIPTKAWVQSAHAMKDATHTFKQFGVEVPSAALDFAQVQANKDGIVKGLVTGVGGLLKANGVTVLALTCDNTTGRFSETYLRTRPKDMNQCEACHKGGPEVGRHRPMRDGIDYSKLRSSDPAMDWKFVARVRDYWKGKFILKGIDTHEDAKLCLEHGLDGILVSNHGGRSTETGRGTIEALPEVVAAVGGKIPVFLDGGVRRGTDVFKALALGAAGVGIGRPTLWGLGSFGEAGVTRVLEILQAELKLVMGNCGTQKVADINRDYVTSRNWKS